MTALVSLVSTELSFLYLFLNGQRLFSSQCSTAHGVFISYLHLSYQSDASHVAASYRFDKVLICRLLYPTIFRTLLSLTIL